MDNLMGHNKNTVQSELQVPVQKNEADFIKLIFGPTQISDLGFVFKAL